MKKEISGIVYDTETAKALVVMENGDSPNSNTYEKRILYRNIDGYYFRYGVGGKNSKFSKRLADDGINQVRVGAERIKPIKNVDSWAIYNMDTKQYFKFWDQNKEILEVDGHHRSQK